MVSISRTKCCHLPLISLMNESAVVYFDCSWSRKQLLSDNINLLKVLEDNGVPKVHHIADEFCEEVESFVIEKGAFSLPCLALYSRGKIVYFSSNIDDFTALSLALKTTAAVESTFSPSVDLCSMLDLTPSSQPVRLFISGDRSSVGKSTCCLYLLAALVQAGVAPSDLAYIKPITQCEAEQPVAKFCEEKGIAHRGVGPVVFYKGFTRAFLEGNTESTEDLLASVVQSVKEIEKGKKFVLIDGVGYPAVGSICGISNADAAKALQAYVLLVGKSGVGDAVDSFNLNCCFFEFAGVRVLGAIFNKIALEGFYNVESCRAAITSYFDQYRPNCKAYGFVPIMDMGAGEEASDGTFGVSSVLLDTFVSHVAVRDIVCDALKAQFEEDCKVLASVEMQKKNKPSLVSQNTRIQTMAAKPVLHHAGRLQPLPGAERKNKGLKRSRADIEAIALSNGAKGG